MSAEELIALAEAGFALGEKIVAIVRAAHAGTVTVAEANAALAAATSSVDGVHATLEARKAKTIADLDAKFPNG